MNKVIMLGRLCTDPELKTTPQGTTVCSFRMAVDRNYQKKGEERKADFFNVVAWREKGEFVSRYFEKGKPILVEGEMQTRPYEKNGVQQTWYEIVADNVYFAGNVGDGGGAKGNAAPPPAPEKTAQSAAPRAQSNAAPPPAPPVQQNDDSDDYPF